MVKISGWKSKTLGTLIDEGKIVIQTGPFGTVLSAKEFVKYGIPVVAVREIREGYIQIFDETPCVSMETYNRLSKYNLATNDLVFARKGNVERSALIPLTKTKYFLGSDGICLRVITKNLLPQYLFYAIQSNTVRSFLIQNAYGTTMAGLNEKILSAIPLFLPVDIDEQSAIAETFSDIERLISSLQKLIEKKKAIKQGTMQELLTGKKRLPGFSGKRKRKKLGNYIKFEVGFPFKSQYFNSQHIGLRLIKNRDLKSDDQVYYTTEDVSSEYIVNNGDVLVGMDGDFTPCIWRKGVALLNQRVGRIGAFGMDLLFSYYLLQQPLQELQIGTGATTVKHLSHFDVEELELTFPEEIKEQQAIAQVLSDMDNDIEQLEKKLAKYQQIKQGMMQELLTGRIRLV